jgi:hypothetical protein
VFLSLIGPFAPFCVSLSCFPARPVFHTVCYSSKEYVWHVTQLIDRETAHASFVCWTPGYKSVCNRKVLRPAISTQVSLVFLYLQGNADMIANFQVATVCFSCSPRDSRSLKLDPDNPQKYTALYSTRHYLSLSFSSGSHLVLKASVKLFVSLQCRNLRQPVGLLGRGISPVASPLPTQTKNKGRQTSMPWVGFEPTIPLFERAKTVQKTLPIIIILLRLFNDLIVEVM